MERKMTAAIMTMGNEMKPTGGERIAKLEVQHEHTTDRIDKFEKDIKENFKSIHTKLDFITENWNKGKGAVWATRIILIAEVSIILWISSHYLPYLLK